MSPGLRETVISTRNLTKEYRRQEYHVYALREASIDILRGEFVALMGPSGSGKSTLLHLIAAMDRPTDGEILVLGHDLRSMSESAVARWRNAHIGGVVVVETVFNYPGIGRLMVTAVRDRDIVVVQALGILSATIYIVLNLAADLLMLALSPRLRTNQ